MKCKLLLIFSIFLINHIKKYNSISTNKFKNEIKSNSISSKIYVSKYPKFIQVQNPDQPVGDAGGGNSGEFVRKDQITEHILIPLLSTFDVEFPFAKDIREYRQDYVQRIDSEINRTQNINISMNNNIPAIPKPTSSCRK